jgi:hypothetical protein
VGPLSVESLAIVLHHSRATGSAKIVALGIANHDGDGGAWPSIATLARYANISPRNAQKAIAQLVALGEVVVSTKAGGTAEWDNSRRPNLYELRVACPTDCDRSKHHRTKRTATTSPLPLRGVGFDTSPERHDESDVSRGDDCDGSRGVAHDPLTIQRNHPENSVGPGSAPTTDRASDSPPAAESIATIHNILSSRRSS